MSTRDDANNSPRNQSYATAIVNNAAASSTDCTQTQSTSLLLATRRLRRRIWNGFREQHASQCSIGRTKPKEGNAQLIHDGIYRPAYCYRCTGGIDIISRVSSCGGSGGVGSLSGALWMGRIRKPFGSEDTKTFWMRTLKIRKPF